MSEVLYKGIEWRRRITVTEVDGTTRTNLTGKVLKLEVKAESTDAATLLTITSGGAITHLTQSGATEGQADAVISTAAQSVLTAETSPVFRVLLDDQVVRAWDFLEVQA